MPFFSRFKSTVFCLSYLLFGCAQQPKKNSAVLGTAPEPIIKNEIIVAANRTEAYLPLLQNKNVALVANQTSVIFKKGRTNDLAYIHLVDSLLSLNIKVKKVFAPEHGFRGKADAGEMVQDGVDTQTGLPIKSLHGKHKKPTQKQLEAIDIVLFDIQDVGVRFYTYIATLELVMEACAEANIPIVVLDRPNPNGHYIDGPTMRKEHSGFLGFQEIPLVYGMTIGEYAKMINEEGWLKDALKAKLTVIPLKHYTHNSEYSLPIRPSPNLPNDQAIQLYPSLGLFEGTHINAGRGTEFQFQRYGASFLDSMAYDFFYIPQPNFGSKYPKEEGKTCFGKDLSEYPKMNKIALQWLIDAYQNCTDKTKFFNTDGFTKHAGTEKLQKQIEAGRSEAEIKASWKTDIEDFNRVREHYLLYE